MDWLLWITIPVTGYFIYICAMSVRDHFKDMRARAVDPTIQEEIDQAPEWWDREFRKLGGEMEHPRQTKPFDFGLYAPEAGDPYQLLPPAAEKWGRMLNHQITELEER